MGSSPDSDPDNYELREKMNSSGNTFNSKSVSLNTTDGNLSRIRLPEIPNFAENPNFFPMGSSPDSQPDNYELMEKMNSSGNTFKAKSVSLNTTVVVKKIDLAVAKQRFEDLKDLSAFDGLIPDHLPPRSTN